jgi:hypothetical protein
VRATLDDTNSTRPASDWRSKGSSERISRQLAVTFTATKLVEQLWVRDGSAGLTRPAPRHCRRKHPACPSVRRSKRLSRSSASPSRRFSGTSVAEPPAHAPRRRPLPDRRRCGPHRSHDDRPPPAPPPPPARCRAKPRSRERCAPHRFRPLRRGRKAARLCWHPHRSCGSDNRRRSRRRRIGAPPDRGSAGRPRDKARPSK